MPEIENIIIGASGHGAVIEDIIVSMKQRVAFFVDHNTSIEEFLGYPVKHTFDVFKSMAPISVIIAVGDNVIRKKLSLEIEQIFLTAIHPSATVSTRSKIGVGTAIMPGAIVNTGASIGRHCILNSNAVIEHDCTLQDFVHVSPNATLAGNVSLGEGVHIGAGAVVLPGVSIGSWSKIGAGAVVLKDVPANAVVVGVPGKVIRIN